MKLKGPRKRGNIVTETLLPEIFLGCANEQEAEKLFCFLAAQTFAEGANFASATNVACARKRGKQCFLVCRGLKNEDGNGNGNGNENATKQQV